MAENSNVAQFGTVYFGLGNVSIRTQPSTLKTNVGKNFVEKDIPLRNTTDKIITVSGVINGLSQTSAQTQAVAIEADRTVLEALEDGYFHAYSDGRNSGNYAIRPGSLQFSDNSDRVRGQPYKFTMELVEWN